MSEVLPKNPEQNHEQRSISFVLCEHTPENYDAIIGALPTDGPSVVAIETLGGSPAARTASEATINAYIAGEDTIEASELHGFDGKLAQALRGSDTVVRYIDAGDGTPEYAAVQAAKKARLAYRAITSDPEAGDIIRNLARERYATTFQQANAAREALVARQLTQLQAEYDDRQLTAVLGAVHAPIAEAFSADSPELTYIQNGQVVDTIQYSEELQSILA